MRALAGVGWQHDRKHFNAYAQAITASTKLLVDSGAPEDGRGKKRELASSRMLLQSFLKSVRFRFCQALLRRSCIIRSQRIPIPIQDISH